MLVQLSVVPTAPSILPGFGGMGAAGSAGLALVSLPLLGLYVPALVHLYRYASFLKRFVGERNVVQLENAVGS